jgi:predicted metal-binding protein
MNPFGKKLEIPKTVPTLTPAIAPVSNALILICEKCGAKLVGEGTENPSRLLQKALKEKIRADERKGEIRAVVSSCMDICPESKIAIGIARSGNALTEYFTLAGDPSDALETILARVPKPE